MRFPDWATRLDQYVSENFIRQFSFDSAQGLDCCRFTFGAIQAQTGVDLGAQFEGTYSTKREALQRMKDYCGRPEISRFIAQLMHDHGFPRRAILSAQRGDAVLCPNLSGYFFGVIHMNGREVISIGEGGLRRSPVNKHCRAWRI